MPLHRPYFPIFLVIDWFNRIALIPLTLLWAGLVIWHFDFNDPWTGLEVLAVVFAIYHLIKQGWWLYYEIIEERGWYRPLFFMTGYLLLLKALYGLSHIHGLAVIALVIPLSIFSYYFRGIVRRRFRIWHGLAYRMYKPYGWVRRYFRTTSRGQIKVFWGGVPIPIQLMTKNFLAIGMIGSGKTNLIRILLQSYLPMVGTGKGYRALVYDATRNMLPIVKGINQHCQIRILSPFDTRFSGWQIGIDITEEAHCQELASLFAPEQRGGGGPDQFWRKAVQHMLHAAALCFVLTFMDEEDKPWTLRDIIEATRSTQRLRAIINSRPELYRFRDTIQDDSRLTQSVMVSLQVYLSQFAVAAALAEHAPHQFSLKHWHEHEESILILGRDVENAAAINALNQLLLTRLTEYLLNREPQPMNTFLCIDEAHTLGTLPEDKFEYFVTNGRKYGVGLLLAVQSYASLIKAYGYELAEAITGQLFWKAFLRMNDRTSQEFAAAPLGYGERFAHSVQRGLWGREAIVETMSVEQIPIVAPSDFHAITPPNPETKTGLTGFYTGEFGYWYTLPSQEISQRLMPKDEQTPAFIKAPARNQILQPWTYDDIKRLRLDHVISPDQHQQHALEQQKLMASVDEVTKDPTNVQELLRKLGIAYDPDDSQGDAAEDNAASNGSRESRIKNDPELDALN